MDEIRRGTLLDLHRLIALREVKLQGSLTAAAQSLQITVSAVSQQIGKLEQEIGTPLLERHGRGVQLTAAAHTLVGAAEDALYAIEQAEAQLRSHGSEMRTLRIAAFPSFNATMLVPLLETLEQEAPYIAVEALQLDPAEAVVEVSSRRADIAIVDEYPGVPLKPTAGLVSQEIALDPMRVHFPRGVAADSDAASLPWAMEEASTDSARWARSVCRELGFEPRVMFEAPDFQLHATLVAAGRAAAFLPQSVVSFTGVPGPQATGFPSDLTRTISAVVRRGARRRPDIELVLEIITRGYASQSGRGAILPS